MTDQRQHVVAVAVVRYQPGNVTSLMVKRPADVEQPLSWHDPGGKVEPMETPYQAAKREMLEEVNLPLETAMEQVCNAWVHRDAALDIEKWIHLYVAVAPDGWQPVLKEAQPASAWVPFEERAAMQPQLATVMRIKFELWKWQDETMLEEVRRLVVSKGPSASSLQQVRASKACGALFPRFTSCFPTLFLASPYASSLSPCLPT
jgi:8-oxo-dGTP pyrophosphatase MutT (NUDIX family)